jgi:DNA-binding MarR family transcriptional regulator
VPTPDIGLGFSLLRVTTQLVEAVHAGLAVRGFGDLRPQHGFAFVRISAGNATLADLAEYLGVSKQAAGQLVDQLVERGYVTREPHPHDGRARLLTLTDKGRACTRAAEDALADLSREWDQRLGPSGRASLARALDALVTPGPLRPSW